MYRIKKNPHNPFKSPNVQENNKDTYLEVIRQYRERQIQIKQTEKCELQQNHRLGTVSNKMAGWGGKLKSYVALALGSLTQKPSHYV